MKLQASVWPFFLLVGATPCALASAQGPASETRAFVGATVISCERDSVPLPDMTVLVKDGRIVAIRSTAWFSVPAGTSVIDARGKFLLPGFTDMHCHLLSDDKIADEFADEELAVIVASGVTTIRNPIGKPELLALRTKIASGAVLGPRMIVGSPQLSGRRFGKVFNGVEVKDPESARAAVRRFHGEGYDGIKLTIAITPAVFDAVIETARELKFPVFGHVGPQVGLARALAAGMQIEHMDEFIEQLLPESSPKRESLSDLGIYRNWDTLELLDEGRIPALVQSVVRAHVWTTPTSAFFLRAFSRGWTDAEVDASPDARFVSPSVRTEQLGGRDYFATKVNPPPAQRKRYEHLRREMMRQLYEAGGKLMTGSDSPECLLLYGFTLHRELGEFVGAGIPPHGALEAATRNPAEWLGVLKDSGTVAEGKRADLVLLAKDPLLNIDHTRAIEGVMLQGRWLPKEELSAMLDRSAQVLSKAPLRPEYSNEPAKR